MLFSFLPSALLIHRSGAYFSIYVFIIYYPLQRYAMQQLYKKLLQDHQLCLNMLHIHKYGNSLFIGLPEFRCTILGEMCIKIEK